MGVSDILPLYAHNNIGNDALAPPYKIVRRLGITRTEVVSIPETYFDADSQHRMTLKRQQADHKWIFDLLDGVALDEHVFIDTAEWMLCRDRHPGPEERFLVVFKDTSLYTIRDLNDTHVPMLMHVQRECRRFLSTHRCRHGPRHGGTEDWRLYFNFMPSVLQLHLHVSRTTQLYSSRVQPLSCVVRNLLAHPCHYQTCLLLTGYTTRPQDSRGGLCRAESTGDHAEMTNLVNFHRAYNKTARERTRNTTGSCWQPNSRDLSYLPPFRKPRDRSFIPRHSGDPVYKNAMRR